MKKNSLRVLVIESDSAYTHKLKGLFSAAEKEQRQKFNLEYAKGLALGLERLAKDGPEHSRRIDSILLDLSLPGCPGIEALSRIYAKAKNTAIVVLLDKDKSGLAEGALYNGAVDCLLKDEIDSKILAYSMNYAFKQHSLLSMLVGSRRKLESEKAQFRDVINSHIDAILVVDDKKIIRFANKVAKMLFDCSEEEFLDKVFEYPLDTGKILKVQIPHKDGTSAAAEMSIVKIEWEEKNAYLVMFRDITERRRAEESLKKAYKELEQISLTDPLTRLYNYRYVMERLKSETARAIRYTIPFSLLMLDIDYFKSINDVYGHQYGDIILKEFAQYLKDSVRVNDVVARYGGEEFVIILPDTNKENAVQLSQRLLDTIGRHLFDAQGNKIRLKMSIGISGFPEDGSTTADLLNLSDKALLSAKERGGNSLCTLKDISKDIKNIMKKDGKEDLAALRKKLSQMTTRANQSLLESIHAFVKTIEAKDYDTKKHAENMVSIVAGIGKKLNLSTDIIEELKEAAVLHDLGKIGIPDSILHKPASLTKEEYEIVKKHPQIGAEIVRTIHFLKPLVPIIFYHHERFDGLGYPIGLKGKEIPIGARIIAIADVYQALISDRPYRKAYGKKEALKIIREGSGTQFDPEIVKVFVAIVK